MESNNPERYIDRYKIMNSKGMDVDTKNLNPYRCSTITVINEASKLVKINQAYSMALKLTDSYTKFYEGCKDFAELVTSEYREDVFYTLRNGEYYENIPAALICLLNKAKDQYEYPNLALSMIKFEDLERYITSQAWKSDYTINDVVNNVWKSDIKIMSPYRRRVEHKTVVELYVEFREDDGVRKLFDTVVLIPKDISDTISDKEVSEVVYSEKKGLVLGDRLLRFSNGRFGITKSDVDMRNAF